VTEGGPGDLISAGMANNGDVEAKEESSNE